MRGATSIVFLLCAGLLQAQQDVFRSKLTVQGGLVRSLGDINSRLESFDLTRSAMLGLSYESFLGYGVSWYGGFEHLRLSGNDRRTGSVDRSLNFLAKVNTAQIGLRFYADNGRLLNYDARFAPFIQLGFGVGTYDVYGDLYDGAGARYNYWSDGTIRTLPEGAPDAGSSQLMEQDEVFETRLTHLATEDGKPHDPWFLFVPARLGMKWHISERFSAELAYAFNWTFTDRLDDVSGDHPASFASSEVAYISNPAGHAGVRGNNGRNDHYHHLSLGLSVGIGRRSHKFRMPPVRALAPVAETPNAQMDTVAAPPSVEEAPADTIIRRVIIEVESIRVGRLEVDTIIMRGSQSAGTVILPEGPTIKDPAVEDMELRSLPDSVLLRTTPDSLKQLEVSADTSVTPYPVAADPELEGSELQQLPDSMSLRTTPDTLMQLQDPVDTTTTSQTVTDPVHPLVRADTVATPRQQPDEQTGSATDTKSLEHAPAGTVEHRTTERIIERVAPPVVVIQKEVVRDTVFKEVPAGASDTARVEADTAAIAPGDTLVRSAPTSGPPDPVRSGTAPNGRSALEMQRDHALQMNRMLNDRIRTLERYLATQEEYGGAVEIDSLRQRIAELDRKMEMFRGSAGAAVTDDTPEHRNAIVDSVHFASNSSTVREAFRESLEATARRIIEQDAPKVLVTGHTDRSGDADYNLALSQRRAEAVADVLRAAGVPSDRIKVKGLGQELASERYDRNERVVIVQVALE